MGLINKFKHGDEQEVQQEHTYADSSAQTGETQTLSHDTPKHDAEEPARDFLGKLIGGSGHHHGPESGDDDRGRRSLLDKLGRKEDREKRQLELEKRELELKYELGEVEKEKKDNEKFIDRLMDKFEGDIDKEKSKIEQNEEDKPSFFDKITGREEREQKAVELDRKEAEIRAELNKIEHDKKENEDLLQKIKDRLQVMADEEAKGNTQHDKPNFLDRITGKAEEEERRRKEEQNKPAFKKFTDQINESLGGGQKGEQNEDLLDKTIDGFQEHILHQGDQSNESAVEQLKDEKIAAAIRKQLHLKEERER
ncbi:hypothetical protein SLS53_004383 [Cytospora paraplurivora]|uniref:Uncharacterized protein n=1 Tax=Cytospora paraplurivora TaxID=2898453 RepID=A0AAN9YFZ3_9PEZI